MKCDNLSQYADPYNWQSGNWRIMLMQGFIRKRSVFVTLLLIGSLLLVISYLSSMQVLASYKQLQAISLLIGTVLGITISLIEVYCFRLKNTKKYKPTFFPYLIMWILLFLNMIFSTSVKLYLLGIFAAYLITLALIFKTYEIVTKKRAITWNELLQDAG